MPASKEYIEIKKQKGICVKCTQPARKDRVSCQRCADLATIRMKRFYDKNKSLGLCVDCSNPVVEGKTMCQSCLEQAKVDGRKRFKKRKQAGICLHCDNPAAENRTLCQHHLEYAREQAKIKRNQNREAGFCYCGKPKKPGFQRCERCLERNKLYGRKRYQQKEYGGNRHIAIKRDGGVCQMCHARKNRMTVHHIDGRGEYNCEDPNHSLENLVTLCQRCHNAFTTLYGPDKNIDLAISILQQYKSARHSR